MKKKSTVCVLVAVLTLISLVAYYFVSKAHMAVYMSSGQNAIITVFVRGEMKRKKHILGVVAVVAIIMQLLPGCMMIGSHDDFAYQPAEKETTGSFIPYLYIQKNTMRIPLLLFRIDIDRLPHSFVMLQYDQTYLNSDEGFRSFVLDTLQLRFTDKTVVDCIAPDLPLEQRTFGISGKTAYEYKKHVFEGVITKRMDFSVHAIGTAIKRDGSRVPFKRTTKYKYNGKDATFHTILDEWASI